VQGIAILWLAARIKKQLIGLRRICARAIRGLLGDAQTAEISPDQWLEVLIPVIVVGADAIGCDHYEARRYGHRQGSGIAEVGGAEYQYRAALRMPTAPGHPSDRRDHVPTRRLQSRVARSAIRRTRAQLALLTVILVGSRLERREVGRSCVGALGGRDGGRAGTGGARGDARAAARRAPPGAKAELASPAAVSRGRLRPPAERAARHPARREAETLRGVTRRTVRGAAGALEAVLKLLTGRGQPRGQPREARHEARHIKIGSHLAPKIGHWESGGRAIGQV
jgi:hypothetical protein